MNEDLRNALEKFAEFLVRKMGENKAIRFLNQFTSISSGDGLKDLVDTLVLYTCQEYGISKEVLFNSTKLIAYYARITCYHILKKHVRIPVFRIAEYFRKRRGDAVTEGLEKAESFLDMPQYNKDFVSKYRVLEAQYLNYTIQIKHGEEETSVNAINSTGNGNERK